MASVWPSQLQDKLNQAGFSHAIGDTVTTTQMGVGRTKKRRRFTKGTDTFGCTITIDRDLYILFYDYFDITLNGGVGSFLFNHPITGVEREWEFASAPNISPIGGRHFSIQMSWELLP